MEVTTQRLRRCDVVTAIGRIDASTVNNLAEVLTTIKEAGRYNIVLNMKDVTYISSIGLSQLIETQKTCTFLKRGELVLVEVPPRIKEALELVGLTPLFKLFDSEIEAVGHF
jgi:anti-sigma B factor antagonist